MNQIEKNLLATKNYCRIWLRDLIKLRDSFRQSGQIGSACLINDYLIEAIKAKKQKYVILPVRESTRELIDMIGMIKELN